MNQDDIAHARLANQGLTGAGRATAAEVVAWLVAVQAQEYAGAKAALGLRARGLDDAAVEQAFAAGDILRTHVLRPTWHFVTPADARWLLALTAPRVHASNGTMYRQLELDEATLRRGGGVMAAALRGGQALTREELGDVLQRAGIAPRAGRDRSGQRLAYLVMWAELEGLIISGPRRGKQFTYMLLDERAPAAATLSRDEALAALAGRYFQSHGPATVQDFARWSSLTLGDSRAAVASVTPALEREVVDGQTYWFSGQATSGGQATTDDRRPVTARTAAYPLPPAAGLSPTPEAADSAAGDWPRATRHSPLAHLLSIYDEYTIGYKDRSAIASAEDGARLAAMGNALQNVMVIDGRIVGTWRREVTPRRVVVELNPFRALTDGEAAAVAAAAQELGAFLGLEVALVADADTQR